MSRKALDSLVSCKICTSRLVERKPMMGRSFLARSSIMAVGSMHCVGEHKHSQKEDPAVGAQRLTCSGQASDGKDRWTETPHQIEKRSRCMQTRCIASRTFANMFLFLEKEKTHKESPRQAFSASAALHDRFYYSSMKFALFDSWQ